MEKKVLKPKDMVKLVAEDTGYLKYEVEDVLASFYELLHNKLVEGHEIRFTNTMTIQAGHVPVRKYWCPKDKVHKTSKGKRTLKVRALEPLERDLQNNPLKDTSMPEVTEGTPFWDKGYRITNILNLDGIIENDTFISHTKLMAFALKENVERYYGAGFFFLTCDNETLSYYISKAGEPNNYEITAIQCLLARAEGELELEIEMIQKTRLPLMFLIMLEACCRTNRTVPNYQAYTIFTESMQGLVFGKPLSHFCNVFIMKGSEALNQEVQNAIKEIKNKELQYTLQEDSEDLQWNTADDDLEIIQQMSLQRFDSKERFSYDYE